MEELKFEFIKKETQEVEVKQSKEFELDLSLLTKKQKDGYDLFVKFMNNEYNKEKKELVFGGYAGVGKTFLTKYLVEFVNTLEDHYVVACAPTAKAVDVMRNKHKLNCDTSTLHSLVFKPRSDIRGRIMSWSLSAEDICDNTLIIVDEASMLNNFMIESLREVRDMKKNCKLLYIGDPAQLRPIGKSDINLFKKIDIFLDEVLRQGLENPIIRASMKIRDGKFPNRPVSDKNDKGEGFVVVRKDDPRFAKSIHMFDKVICGTNRMVHHYNKVIRENLGLDTKRPVVGDILMCQKNHKLYGTYNGMEYKLLWISDSEYELDNQRVVDVKICPVGEDDREITMPMSMEKFYDYKFNVGERINKDLYDKEKAKEYKDISFFYFSHAISCHKSQGSSFERVAIHSPSSRWMKEEFYNAMYVGVTRAEKLAVVMI